MEPPPDQPLEKLPCRQKIDKNSTSGNDNCNESFEQQAQAQKDPEERRPPPRRGFVNINGALKRKKSRTNHERQHHIRNLDTREKKEPNACPDHHPRVAAGLRAKCPSAIKENNPGQKHSRQCHWDSRSPIVKSENFVGEADQPINHRRLFQVRYAVESRAHPIA